MACYDKNYGSITNVDLIKEILKIKIDNKDRNNVIFMVDPNGIFFGNENYGSLG